MIENLTDASVDEVAVEAKELASLTRESLYGFRLRVYAIAARILTQIIERYPQIVDARGASIEVILPHLSKERIGIYHIDRVQLADGRTVQAICGMADSKEATPVFLALPKVDVGKRNFVPDRLMIGTWDRNDCEEPGLGELFQFLDLVATDMPATLDHIKVWRQKTIA